MVDRHSIKANKPGALAAFPYDRMTVERFREAFLRARWNDQKRAWFVPGKTAALRLTVGWRARQITRFLTPTPKAATPTSLSRSLAHILRRPKICVSEPRIRKLSSIQCGPSPGRTGMRNGGPGAYPSVPMNNCYVSGRPLRPLLVATSRTNESGDWRIKRIPRLIELLDCITQNRNGSPKSNVSWRQSLFLALQARRRSANHSLAYNLGLTIFHWQRGNGVWRGP